MMTSVLHYVKYLLCFRIKHLEDHISENNQQINDVLQVHAQQNIQQMGDLLDVKVLQVNQQMLVVICICICYLQVDCCCLSFYIIVCYLYLMKCLLFCLSSTTIINSMYSSANSKQINFIYTVRANLEYHTRE